MSQVTYRTEKVKKKRVRYTGTETLKTGYPLCGVEDADTGGTGAFMWQVEQPTTENLDFFAGLVSPGYNNRTGPCEVEVIEPESVGRFVKGFVGGLNTTANSTQLGLVGDTWALGAASASQPQVAFAMESATGLTTTPSQVLVQLQSVPMADDITATAATLTGTTTGGTALVSFTATVPGLTGGTTGGTALISFTATAPALTGGTTGATTTITGTTASLGVDVPMIGDAAVKNKADILALYVLIQRNADAIVAQTADVAVVQANASRAAECAANGKVDLAATITSLKKQGLVAR